MIGHTFTLSYFVGCLFFSFSLYNSLVFPCYFLTKIFARNNFNTLNELWQVIFIAEFYSRIPSILFPELLKRELVSVVSRQQPLFSAKPGNSPLTFYLFLIFILISILITSLLRAD